MSSQSVNPPFPIFTDKNGLPLESGYIWIGVENENALSNPEKIYWDSDLSIPAHQPVRTINGYPSRSGTPGRIYTASKYSIVVKNKNLELVYGSMSTTESSIYDTDVIFSFYDVSDMLASSEKLLLMPDGTRVRTDSYFSDGSGGGFNGVIATGAHTNNGGSVHSLSATRYVSVTDTFTLCDPRAWGVRAKTGIDDHAAWTAMMAWYKTKIKTKTVPGQSPTFTAPELRGIDGTSELSDKLLFPDFLVGDFSKTGFKRHAAWSAPAGRYLLGFTELYQADFGGVTISQEDYVFEIYNANLDKGVIHMSGVHNSLNDNFMKVEVQSSSFVYSNFRSDNCKHFLDLVRSDHMKLKDGWITQGALTTVGDATIKVGRAYLSIENVVGVPAYGNAAKCAWINNNNGRVYVDGFRAGGENSGCALINNYALNRTITDADPTPVGFIVQNSECYSADTQSGTQKSCIIRLFELPNFIVYENNTGHQLTQEIISWDSGVTGKQAKINTLLSKRTGFNFSYNDILEYNAVQPYDDSLACLFGRTLRVPLGYTVTTAGQVFCETRLRPRNGQVYRLTVKANPAAGGSSEYRSIVTADIHIVTGISGGNAVRRVIVANLTQTPGGATFTSNINVSVGFWNGASKTQDAVVNSDDHRLYVDITGLQSGQETSFVSGYIEQIL